MSEFTEALKTRYSKQRNSEIADKMAKQRVKVSILTLCDTYIKQAEDHFIFECNKNDLQHVVVAINEDPLKSKYFIQQIAETLFDASLIAVDLV